MAANFRIFIHRSSDCLHLKLDGDFDGTSAHELIESIRENGNGARKIFVHTNGLKEVVPFGCAVFQKNLSLREESSTLVFTGRGAQDLASGIRGQVMVV